MLRFSGATVNFGEDTATPSISMRPAVGLMKPAIIRKVVVLPQPDGPSSDTNSPSRRVRSTSATAGTGPKLLPRPIRDSLLMDAPAAA